jgi:GT2 family glycosyltransferase
LQTTKIILPVSREQHLLRVFASLEVLECDRERTGLLIYVDGDEALYVVAANLVDQSKFADRQCIRGDIPGPRREFSINTRRRRIAAIHNSTRKLIKPCDYVFLIEDDGILGPDALSRLLADYQAHPYAGFIEGVELGRWGIPHVGAWRADDVYDMKRLESAMPVRPELLNDAGRAIGRVPDHMVQEIDAGGLYACLTRYRHYVDHEFRPYRSCTFGPDVDWGIALRQQGYKNYLDWSVAIEHCRADGTSTHPRQTQPVRMTFTNQAGSWRGQPS